MRKKLEARLKRFHASHPEMVGPDPVVRGKVLDAILTHYSAEVLLNMHDVMLRGLIYSVELAVVIGARPEQVADYVGSSTPTVNLMDTPYMKWAAERINPEGVSNVVAVQFGRPRHH